MRVNVLDQVKGGYVPKVHVKAIGSSDKDFKSGDTDLRGIFATEGLNGTPTIIARSETLQYAFYRGETALGAPPANAHPNAPAQQKQMQKQLEDQRPRPAGGVRRPQGRRRRQERRMLGRFHGEEGALGAECPFGGGSPAASLCQRWEGG